MDWKQPWLEPDWQRRTRQLLDSYQHFLGQPLCARVDDPRAEARLLFEHSAPVLAHGTQPDPIFCYGNRAALTLWEIDLPTLLQTPSRKTAEPERRAERGSMLQRGLANGAITDYQGIRISTSGRRFLIRNATIWNVLDAHGYRVGQAATFSEWTYLASPDSR